MLNMSGVILLLVIIICTLFASSTLEGFAELTPPTLPMERPNWQNRLDELEDTDNVLKRTTTTGEENIAQLKPVKSKTSLVNDNNYKQLRSIADKEIKYTKDTEQECLSPNHPVYTMIEERQPYMFTEPHVVGVDVTNIPHYYDWRYPRKPISVKFASDPVGYCKRNPNTYPCYVIASRKTLK